MNNIYQSGDIYTDLMTERGRAPYSPGVEYESESCGCGIWERILIKERSAAEKMGRPCGKYSTLNIDKLNLIDKYFSEEIEDEVANELWEMCEAMKIRPVRVLVVGLGNEELTPDSLGPMSAKLVLPTMHIKNTDERAFRALNCAEVAVLRPGVTAESGMDAAEAVFGVAERLNPDLVVAIDALCAVSEERLGSTVQISDTGVHPGSGVGNPRRKITADSVGCPVIAIGIPTVIDMGITSSLRPKERMLVTPREINAIVKRGAEIISGGINRAFGIIS